MSAANYLVRWMPDIVEATADDIARFGPNAAQVRALLNYIPTISDEAARQSWKTWDATDGDAWWAARDAVRAARDAVRDTERYAAWEAAQDAAKDASRNPAWWNAASDAWLAARAAVRGEAVSDLITPEQYRILTNPLNLGRTLQERMGLMIPDQQGPFMRMVNQLSPVSPEDILAIERLSGNPNVAALLEMLAGMTEGQPLARRIKAAETMYRAGRGGRGMS